MVGSSRIRAGGLAEEGLAEHHAELQVGGDRVHLFLPMESGGSHPAEEYFGIGFSGIAIFVADDLFELAQADPHFVGHLFVRKGVPVQ